MKLSVAITLLAAMLDDSATAQNNMVKMCLFYKSPSGHARSDPIINQNCASGHVHTFYGPQNFHPNTSYEDIRDTPARFSSTPFVENQSLYWHPSIYQVTDNTDGTKTYTRIDNLESSPYYRWDNSVAPTTEAFPPGFRMISHSDDAGANQGGETGGNMLTECCNLLANEEEDCMTWDKLHFPTRSCDFLGIALAMPTCWDGKSLGDNNDHKSHMAYTTNGDVNGPCPTGFDRRLPQVQLFVRVTDYKGGTYQLSDSSDVWHVDFFNGWKEGKLQEIIDNCQPDTSADAGYNPPCGCTPDFDDPNFLTRNNQEALPVCDSDVRRLIIDEATNVTNKLPTGSCEGNTLIPKSWSELSDGLFDCVPATRPPSDSDVDGDAGEDGQSDVDGEGDADEDWHSDIDIDGDGDGDGDGDADEDWHSDIDGDGEAGEEWDSGIEGGGDADEDWDSDIEGDGDANEDWHSGDGDADEDWHSGYEDSDEDEGSERFTRMRATSRESTNYASFGLRPNTQSIFIAAGLVSSVLFLQA